MKTNPRVTVEPFGKLCCRISELDIARRDEFDVTIFLSPLSELQKEEEQSDHQGMCTSMRIKYTEEGELLLIREKKEYIIARVKKVPAQPFPDYELEILTPIRKCTYCGK
jgi:hypothetical protein